MKKKIYSAIVIVLLLFINTNAQQSYYYYHGNKIFLTVDSLVRFVAVDPNMNEEQKQQLFPNLERYAQKHELFTSNYVFDVEPNQIDAFVWEMKKHDSLIMSQSPGYWVADSILLFPTKSIIIKLIDEHDMFSLLDSLQIEYKNITKDAYINNRYQIDLYQDNAVDVAAKLYETGLLIYSTPSFISPYVTTGYYDNTYFYLQWSALNDSINMNLLSAWNISTGSNRIKTALIDEGVDLEHQDLIPNLLPGFCTIPGSYEPCNGSFKYPVEGHGTLCAGVIAAANNNMGVVGVAHTSKLIPIKTTYDFPVGGERLRNDFVLYSNRSGYIVSQWVEDAFQRACYELKADVISFSLDIESPSDAFEDVVTDVCCNGRGGKGLIMVFSAGDYNIHGDSTMSYIAKHPYVISVGAISYTGDRMSYPHFDGSCYGDSLDVVAPGKNIPTTKIYNSYGSYSGTSAAAPHVAGLAALVLSVNPCLTRKEVKYVIESTCTKVRPDIYNYAPNPNHPNGTWNIEVGHGLVNAGAAVALAQQMGGYAYVNDTLVSNDTVWNTNRLISQDLVIDSLATLTISDTVYISSSARIIVKPGGKLVVDGGTLTSACAGGMWQGIYVEGHRNQAQTASRQGTVQLINGAVIENAHCAITTAVPPLCGGTPTQTDLLSTGGIITADGATFRNCTRAVYYLPYASVAGSGNVADNKGSFHNCTFTIDDNNLYASNGTDFIEHVRLWDVKGVTFSRCRFEDVRTGVHSRGIAVNAMSAGFTVRTECQGTAGHPYDCACPTTTNSYCSFAGFGTAVSASTSGSPYPVAIDGARFAGNLTGVSISGSSHSSVTHCQFDLGETQVRAVTGLSLNGCTGYLVEENTFTRDASAPSGSRYGIRVNNSGTDANGLYRNTFERLSHGMYVTGTNGDGNSNTGLQMTCNEFTDNTYDMYLHSTAIVSSWQGDNSKGADNTFSGTQTSSLHNAGSQPLTYLYGAGTSHVPYNPTTSNVTLNGTVPSNNCASTLCSNGGGTPNPMSPTPSFLALKQQYENLMADFNRNGYADILSTAIPPLYGGTPNVNQETIEAAQYASQQMNAIASELFAQSHEAVRALMSDTLEDLQAVVAWLDATPGLASRYLAAEAEFATDGSNLLLADIANHIATSEERDEYDNYLAFYSLKEALRYGNGHVAWPNATDAHIGELIRIADANTGRSSLLAKNVLCFFFGICYDDMETRALETTTIPPTAEPPALTESRMKAEPTTLTGQQNITVHPNPTNDVLHVTVTDGNAKIARVEMFDMFGRPVSVETHGRASLPSPQTTVNTSDIPSGLYILRVTLTDGTVQNIKVARK